MLPELQVTLHENHLFSQPLMMAPLSYNLIADIRQLELSTLIQPQLL